MLHCHAHQTVKQLLTRNTSPVSISGAGATLNLVRAKSSAVKFTLTTIHLPWPGAGFALGTPSRLRRFFGHSRIDCPRAENGISYIRKSASSTRKGQLIPGRGITTF